MQYQVLRHVEGRKFIPWLDDATHKVVVLSTAQEAAALADFLSKKFNAKFQPRPLRVLSDWRDRERKRFAGNEYKPVIWLNEAWWKDITDHFAHVAVKDPTRIAFTPDAEKGEADKQTLIAPGKYLQKFFGDVLSCGQIRTHAMQHSLQFEQNELKFASTVEEIERVYKPTLGCSCFSGTTKANLYGSGDFAVAYLEDENGKVTARCVCIPSRKIYIHPYGDYERIGSLLEKAGYKDAGYTKSHFTGLRLLKKWHWHGFYGDWGTPRLVPDPENDKFLIID